MSKDKKATKEKKKVKAPNPNKKQSDYQSGKSSASKI